MGKKWSSISKVLSGRTENAVKNRWNTLMKSVQQTAGCSNYEIVTEYLISHIEEMINSNSQE